MVHDSKARLRVLNAFIRDAVPGATVEVSDVKRDGTVFVRFKSGRGSPCDHAVATFVQALRNNGHAFVPHDENQIRLPLQQFAVNIAAQP